MTLFIDQFHNQNGEAQQDCDHIGGDNGNVADEDSIGEPKKATRCENDIHAQRNVMGMFGANYPDCLRKEGNCGAGCGG